MKNLYFYSNTNPLIIFTTVIFLQCFLFPISFTSTINHINYNHFPENSSPAPLLTSLTSPEPFPSLISLSDPSILTYPGSNIGPAGDVNNDGIQDFLIGSPTSDVGSIASAGKAFLIYGTPNLRSINLYSLNGSNGVEFIGQYTQGRAGSSVTSAGDFNGDQYDDILISASSASNGAPSHGVVYLIFGSAHIPSPFNLHDIDGTNGVVFTGETQNSYFGSSISSAGDFNHDGFFDIIISSSSSDSNTEEPTSELSAYLLYGTSDAMGSHISLFNLPPNKGAKIIPPNLSWSGIRVHSSPKTDINGDGLNDLIISCYSSSHIGQTFVIYGTGFDISLTHLPFQLQQLSQENPSYANMGFTINGTSDFSSQFGYSISSGGDINGDGFGDLLIGSPFENELTGVTYVLYGSQSSPSTVLIQNATSNPLTGFQIIGLTGSKAGTSVAIGGDFNSDGYSDLLVGLPSATPADLIDAGKVYLIYGKRNRVSPTLLLSSLGTPDTVTSGAEFDGISAYDFAGSFVISPGDLDGNSSPDILISASNVVSDSSILGEIYLLLDISCKTVSCKPPSPCDPQSINYNPDDPLCNKKPAGPPSNADLNRFLSIFLPFCAVLLGLSAILYYRNKMEREKRPDLIPLLENNDSHHRSDISDSLRDGSTGSISYDHPIHQDGYDENPNLSRQYSNSDPWES